MSSPDWSALKTRYAPFVVAVLLVLIVPASLRQALWTWVLKGSDLVEVIAIGLVLSRLSSHGEHRATAKQIDGLHYKLENGITSKLDEIVRYVRKDP